MTLVTRVSVFFLAALAVALAGYSVACYCFARTYLLEQFDSRLGGVMAILAASVEVEEDDAKWQPEEHGIDRYRDVLAEARWLIADEHGRVIDHSPGLSPEDPRYDAIFQHSSRSVCEDLSSTETGEWRILQRQLDAPRPKPVSERDPHDYASIRITVARSVEALNSTLLRLAVMTIVLPVAIWLLAAAMGGVFVRRALRPLREMTQSVGSIEHADFAHRLPDRGSQDELALLGREFNRLLDRLEQAYEQQRRFAGDAAHQLRTPLTILQGQIDVLRRRERTAREYCETLSVLSGQIQELSRIVESLLFLARPDREMQPPRMNLFHVNAWVTSYVERWQNTPRAGDLAVQLGDDAVIEASEALLTQLLDNLMHNAFKYSAAGTSVTLTTMVHDRHVTFAIEDQGIGMSREDRALVFEPFFRSSEARRAGIAGAGLGLSIAARIAAGLHGTLECDSIPGAGSTFFLRLPCGEPRT